MMVHLEGVSLATIIMISSLLQDSSDGLDAVLVQMIQGITNKVRCTQSKNKVKKNFFNFHTPFDREFQGGQEYVCLEVF